MSEDFEEMSTAKVTGVFIMIGIAIGMVGWVMLFIFPPLAFVFWGLGGIVALLAIPLGVFLWFSRRGEKAATAA